MSQQADGLKPSDRHVEEEGHGMQIYNKPLDKTNNHAFVSSKINTSSDVINHINQNSFIDDDLVTWFQYPLDDGAACHDMLQHWPLPSPAPALDNFTPSPVLKDLTHQQNDALMIDVASDGPLEVCEGMISVENGQKMNAHLKQVSHSEGKIMQQRIGEAQQHEPLFKHGNGVASASSGAALRQAGDDERQSVAKDCRKLSHLKLLPQEDERAQAAKAAHLVTNGDTHSRHSEKRMGQDNNWAHTTQLRHQPQHQGAVYLNLPTHYNVVGSSSGSILQKEASANSPSRKEESWLEKGLSRKLSAFTDSTQALNVQANPAADAALALGAGRAAGVIRPSGMEAFSKVRTSLQPTRPSNLGSPPAVYMLSPTSPYTSYPSGYSPPVLPPRGRAFSFRDSTLSTQPVQQAVQPHWFRPCASFPSIGSQENQLVSPLIGNNNNSSKDSHLESSTTALLGSQGAEESNVILKQLPHTEQTKDIGVGSSAAAFYGMDTLNMQKPSGLSLQYRDKKDDVVFSGGSETSESLKETFSGSKRKLDDSECQSEDAEGESAVNSQGRSSSSKRTRANEVHNLSERRRRNRINDKMNALRELIPNATKSNKAALLDEAIDYLKNLQLQLQVMSMRTGVSLSPMVLPLGLPHMQMPQASPIHPMGIGTTGGCSSGMGLGGAGSTVGVAMCDIMYSVLARPLTSFTSLDPRMLQPSADYSNIQPQVITAAC